MQKSEKKVQKRAENFVDISRFIGLNLQKGAEKVQKNYFTLLFNNLRISVGMASA